MTRFIIWHVKEYNEVGWKLNEDTEFFPACLPTRSLVAGACSLLLPEEKKTGEKPQWKEVIVPKAKEISITYSSIDKLRVDYLRESLPKITF